MAFWQKTGIRRWPSLIRRLLCTMSLHFCHQLCPYILVLSLTLSSALSAHLLHSWQIIFRFNNDSKGFEGGLRVRVLPALYSLRTLESELTHQLCEISVYFPIEWSLLRPFCSVLDFYFSCQVFICTLNIKYSFQNFSFS